MIKETILFSEESFCKVKRQSQLYFHLVSIDKRSCIRHSGETISENERNPTALYRQAERCLCVDVLKMNNNVFKDQVYQNGVLCILLLIFLVNRAFII